MSSSIQNENSSEAIEETFTRYDPNSGIPESPEPEKSVISPPVERRVPAQSIVPTRITGLDNLINGGLPDRSLLLIVGDIGSGYSTFINQILYNHASEGGKIAYYTMETSGLDVQQEMSNYGWSSKRYVEGGQWQFIDVLTPDLQQLSELAPESFSGLRVNLGGSLNSLKSDLLQKIKEERWTVLHLSHLLHNYDIREVMGLLLYWRAAVRSYGGIHMAVLPSGVHQEASVNAMKNIADGVLEFQLREGPRDFEGFLVVQKMRGLRTAKRVQFSLNDYGVAVETATRIR